MLQKMVMIAVLLVSLADGCQQAGDDGGKGPPYNEGPANAHCSVRADYPHWSSGSPDWIDGKVWVTCTGATIEKLTIEAKLQRLDNGKWHDLPSSMPLSQTFAPAKAGQTTWTYSPEAGREVRCRR
jgi:hypothetical protein